MKFFLQGEKKKNFRSTFPVPKNYIGDFIEIW